MESLKRLIIKYFEILLVFFMLATVALIHFFVINKTLFLNVYYLPTLLAGFVLGRRSAIFTGLLSIALVTYFVIMRPDQYLIETTTWTLMWDLIIWGCFLILTSCAVGTLYEYNKRKNQELKETYEGVVEILAKFIDSVDHYTNGHSVRVAELATEIATRMGLSDHQIEVIRVAGLLHDIGKAEISAKVILKAAKLSEEEINELKTHPVKGGQILSPFGNLFKDVVAVIVSHHRYYDGSGYGPQDFKDGLLNVGILAVADAYDAMITDRPYRAGKPPWKALEEIEEASGKQFHPQVVEVFREVVLSRLET